MTVTPSILLYAHDPTSFHDNSDKVVKFLHKLKYVIVYA